MIDLTELPSLSLEERWSLPSVQCVYFVLGSNGQVLYIGQTINLRNRWGTHSLYKALKDIGNIRLAWMPVTDKNDENLILEVEQILINHYKPEFNFTKPAGTLANLCIKIDPELRQYWAVEAKKRGVSMTQAMMAGLASEFSTPDNPKNNY